MFNQPPTLSNFNKWRYYCDGLPSPDSFINFGYYFLIGAALQRRVWIGSKHDPIYGNQYCNFVADPGIGKGLVIRRIDRCLRHWKLQSATEKTTTIVGDSTGRVKSVQKGDGEVEEVDRVLTESVAQANYEMADGEEKRGLNTKYNSYEKPLLFPMAPNNTTFEALIISLGRALRRKNYVELDPATLRNMTKIYTHSSLTFCLEEVGSLFKKHAEDVVIFLQEAYDCRDYVKDTKTQGKDRIKNCCVSFIGGTQPHFLQRSFGQGILNEGYASRTMFLYEARNRKNVLVIPALNEEQLKCENDILNHIKVLSELYGEVTYTDEAYKYLVKWWDEAQLERPNLNPKLLHYYARKSVHVQKLAMALHFGEQFDSMVISLETAKKAIELLDAVERKMHHALVTKSENPYYKIGVQIIKFIEDTGAKSKVQLLAKFWEELPGPAPKEALEKIIEHYSITGKINEDRSDGKTIKYDVVREKLDGNDTYEN